MIAKDALRYDTSHNGWCVIVERLSVGSQYWVRCVVTNICYGACIGTLWRNKPE